MGYRILIEHTENGEPVGGEEHPLADRSARNVRRLRKLQVRTGYYADQERRSICEEMGWEDKWLQWPEDEEEAAEVDPEELPLKEPDLPAFEFKAEAAKVLFPTVDIEDREDYLDYEVVEEALQDFLSRIARPQMSLKDLQTLLAASQNGATTRTVQNQTTSATESAP